MFTKYFQNPEGRDTTLATTHEHDNKNTFEANMLCSLTFKVLQERTVFRIIYLRPLSLKRLVAKTAAPNCPRQSGFARRSVLDSRALYQLS